MNIDKTKLILIGIIILLLCGFLFERNKRINAQNEKDAVIATMMNPDTVKLIKEKLASTLVEVAQNKATILNQKEDIEALQKDVKLKALVQQFKSPDAIITARTHTVFDTIPIYFVVDDSMVILKDTTLVYNDPNVSLKLRLERTGVVFQKIEFNDTLRMVVGTHKNGFFKKNDYEIKAFNSNPYSHIQGLTAMTYHPDEPWYKSRTISFVAGIVVFGLVNHYLIK